MSERAEAAEPRNAGTDVDGPRVPGWLRDLQSSVFTHPQFVLHGNVRDQHLWTPPRGPMQFLSLLDRLWYTLDASGYHHVLVADPVDGLRLHLPRAMPRPEREERLRAQQEVLRARYGIRAPQRELDLAALADRMRHVVHGPDPDRAEGAEGAEAQDGPDIRPPGIVDTPVALIIDYAGRLVTNPANLMENEQAFFTAAEKLAHQAMRFVWPDERARYNPLIWLVHNEQELPASFMSPSVPLRRIAVPVPQLDDRLTATTALLPLLPESAGLTGEQRAALARRFADSVQGLPLNSLPAIVELSRSGIPEVSSMEAAARSYRLGVRENPWGQHELRGRLRDAEETLNAAVLGQQQAVGRAVDILVRSVMGLSGAQASSVVRPRGVLFLAGPTGVGKTELAKAISQLVFGEADAYIRFDMSEFAAEHSADRLTGAPPGYVGYDAGGELTNAVRQSPFSLLLFDEIEKAAPRILDKFLQVLDDGRLTDGTGSTVHFSESIIVFTSNLGMQASDGPPLTPQTDRAELERRVEAEIRRHFVETLRRPELLNRLGDNIVVFGFIDEPTGARIFEQQLARVLARVRQQHAVDVRPSAAVRAALVREATSDTVLAYGGRGIGSFLESAFVNPLAHALFREGFPRGTVVEVTELGGSSGRRTLTLRRSGPPPQPDAGPTGSQGGGPLRAGLVKVRHRDQS
ncbi:MULTISPECIES: AAA family ATPase [Frankia]|nr:MULTISPECIES: AAA family ATPase [Frankia]